VGALTDKLKGRRGVSFKEGGEFDLQPVEKDSKVRSGSSKKMTPQEKKAELERKKKQMMKSQRDKRKKGETLEARMGQSIKQPKDAKFTEQQKKSRLEIEHFIKTNLLDGIITAA